MGRDSSLLRRFLRDYLSWAQLSQIMSSTPSRHFIRVSSTCPYTTFHAQRRREGLSSDLMEIWLWCFCSTQAIWESGNQVSLGDSQVCGSRVSWCQNCSIKAVGWPPKADGFGWGHLGEPRAQGDVVCWGLSSTHMVATTKC